jgi:hypothetical protein
VPRGTLHAILAWTNRIGLDRIGSRRTSRDQGQPAAVPDQQLHPVGALGAEHEYRTAERVEAKPLLHHGRKAVHPLPKVDRLGRDEHLEPSARQDDATDFIARRILESAPSATSMTSATEAFADGASVAPTTGTNDSSAADSRGIPAEPRAAMRTAAAAAERAGEPLPKSPRRRPALGHNPHLRLSAPPPPTQRPGDHLEPPNLFDLRVNLTG